MEQPAVTNIDTLFVTAEKKHANNRTPLHILSREIGEPGLAAMLEDEVMRMDWNDDQKALVFKARDWNITIHAGQYRDDGQPYSTHPLRNALRFITKERMGIRDQPYLTAAILLHDSVEDNPWGVAGVSKDDVDRFDAQTMALEKIIEEFGTEVAVYVAQFTIPPYPREDMTRQEKLDHHHKHRLKLLEQDSIVGLAMLTDPIDNAGATEHEISSDRVNKIMEKYIPELPMYEDFIKRNIPYLSKEGLKYLQEVFHNTSLAHQAWLNKKQAA